MEPEPVNPIELTMNRHPLLRACLAALVLVAMSSPVRPEAQEAPAPEIEWTTEARFEGTVVGMDLGAGDLPTLPVGYDPRYTMQVRVSKILDGRLPVGPGERLGFLIHSPSLFFMRNLGRKPDEFQGFIEGPFEFTILRRDLEEGRAAFDLRIRLIPSE